MRTIHHKDCTYCRHRRNTPKPIQKKKAKLDMMEVCSQTGLEISPPHTIERYCDQYQQQGCECPSCLD